MNVKATLRDLRSQFRGYAVSPDGLFLLTVECAIELIEKATAGGARLAGIEGFLISSAGAYEPIQDFSNDIADWQLSPLEFVESTKELMKEGASIGIRFQVVFEEE